MSNVWRPYKSQFLKSVLIPLPSSIPHCSFMWCKGKLNLPFWETDLDLLFNVKNNFYWKKKKVWENLTVARQYMKNLKNNVTSKFQSLIMSCFSEISDKEAGLYQTLGVTWEDTCHNSKCPPLPPSARGFYCWTQMPYCLEHHFGQLGSAVLVVCPPNFLCTSSLLSGRAVWEAEKALLVCMPCSATTNHSCVISTVHHKSKTYPCTSYYDEI